MPDLVRVRSQQGILAAMKMLITDLDGTLRHPELGILPANRRALEALGGRGVQRVIATGRSLHHVRKVLEDDFPCDWLIHSSGAGRLSWPDGQAENHAGLDGRSLGFVIQQLKNWQLPFSLHLPSPASHTSFWWRGQLANHPDVDFDERIARNPDCSSEHEGSIPGALSFLLVITPDGQNWPQRLARAFPQFRLLHSRSPIGGRSRWIELVPPDVSKSQAAASLAKELGLGPGDCMALGNDFNDEDLLDWAGSAGVVSEAPVQLKSRFPVLCACAEGIVQAALLGGQS